MAGNRQLALLDFGGARVSLEVNGKDSWKLKVWDQFSSPEKPEEEVFTDVKVAVLAFEQTARGIFFKSKLSPANQVLPVDVVFDLETTNVISSICCESLNLHYDSKKTSYDICITQPVIINTKSWPLLQNQREDFNYMRLRLFDGGNFKVLFENVLWDNGIPRRFTRTGYDIVELRSRGDGIVRGCYYLNVPDQANDSRYLKERSA